VKMRLGRATILIGPAASGKSNILEALALATYFDRRLAVDVVHYVKGRPHRFEGQVGQLVEEPHLHSLPGGQSF